MGTYQALNILVVLGSIYCEQYDNVRLYTRLLITTNSTVDTMYIRF